jgi:hypothetical protein
MGIEVESESAEVIKLDLFLVRPVLDLVPATGGVSTRDDFGTGDLSEDGNRALAEIVLALALDCSECET